MKVKLYPSDATGCGLSRMVYPGRAARAHGVYVEIAHCEPTAHGAPPARKLPIERHPGDPRLIRAVAQDADVLVFQRPFEEALVAILPQLKTAGHTIIVELDDDIERVPAQHPGHRHLNPAHNRDSNWRHLREACKLADLLIVSSDALADRYGQHCPTVVLPNCVPESVLALPHRGDGRTVGWAGGTVTHPGDLRVTGGGVAQALDDTGGRFLQVGPITGVQEQLNLLEAPEATGGLDEIGDYYRALTRLDIGICPLADSQFNQSKSSLKVLEMAAAGAAVIASPVAEYQRAADEGLCELAGYRGREWRRAIRRLLQDEDLRRERAQHARMVVAERHTYEKNAGRWINAWQAARESATRAPVAA